MVNSASHRALAIVPAWNEQDSVGATVTEILADNPGLEVLVVDDGSTDKTAAAAEAAGATVLYLPFNLGVGGAMRAGYQYAHRYDFAQAIQVDADGQHDPLEISRVLAGLDQADICIGARFAGEGAYVVHGPRHWAMVLLAAIVSHLAHAHLTDITSGFRAANQAAIAQYCRHYPAEYLGDTVDSLIMAVRSGYSVTQVPVHMRIRRAGKPSHNPWQAAFYFGRSVFALLIALTRRVKDVD